MFDASGRYVVDSHVTVLRVQASKLDPRWLVAILQSPYGQHYLESHCYSGSTNQVELARSPLACWQIPLPPLTEQRRIGDISEIVAATIRETDALIAKLKLARVGLLHDLLSRGLNTDGQVRDPHTHPEQFGNTRLGRLPCTWRVSKLEDVKNPDRAYIRTGPFGSTLKGEHWVEEGVPVITIGSLGEGSFIDSDLLHVTESKAASLSQYGVEQGDVVFSRVADVGRSVVITEHEVGWIMSSNLMRISLDRSLVMPEYIYLNLAYSDKTRQQIRQSVNAGGREVANTAILNSLQFAWPPLDEQKRIVRVANAYDSRIRTEEAYREKLKLLKQGLMDDLLTGRVRVPVAEKAAV